MSELSAVPFALINIACLAGLAATLLKDHIKMRVLLVVTAALLLIVHLLSGQALAWISIVWFVAFAAANIFIVVKESSARSTSKFSKKEKYLYQIFKGTKPSEFKQLLQITHWHTAEDHTILTQENEVCDKLFLVMKGSIEINKGDSLFTLPATSFIGEVGYFLRSAATATTIVEKGSLYVSWKVPELRQLESEVQSIRAAIYELINKDMANKVAASTR